MLDHHGKLPAVGVATVNTIDICGGILGPSEFDGGAVFVGLAAVAEAAAPVDTRRHADRGRIRAVDWVWWRQRDGRAAAITNHAQHAGSNVHGDRHCDLWKSDPQYNAASGSSAEQNAAVRHFLQTIRIRNRVTVRRIVACANCHNNNLCRICYPTPRTSPDSAKKTQENQSTPFCVS